MLIYIPTITMGIWADERKQGTDELLLTMPASDFDIVLGQVLGGFGHFHGGAGILAAVQLAVLKWLGDPDFGLFASTYVGYWLVGVAMLAIGTVASFLTSNVTIGFVLGVLLNMPLVFLSWADALFGALGQQRLQVIEAWSISRQLADFTSGVLSLAGVAYFLAILVVMLYVEHGAHRPAALVQRRRPLRAGRPLRRSHLAPWCWSGRASSGRCAITTCGSTPPARSSALCRRRRSSCSTR